MRFKNYVARAADGLRAFEIGRRALRFLHGDDYIRVVNYHATPAERAENFAAQLDFYRSYFSDTTPADLDDCLRGVGTRRTPGLLLSFDDGYVSNYEVAAPLLEKAGFTGWFFVSSGRLGDVDAREPSGRARPGERFMTIDELRDLRARGHVIGFHSHSHQLLGAGLARERLRFEILESKQAFERALGFPLESFCWVGGAEPGYSAQGAALVAQAGYRFAFTTNLSVLTAGVDPLILDRTNIEVDWPMEQVKFYLSGVMDIAYLGKRRRVTQLLRRGGDGVRA
jgi:peptidoglycan/xylan/chitin deacetylase (PgdA/CDA1 family)